MKKIYLLFLLCCFGYAASAQIIYQPLDQAAFTGAASYCKDAAPSPLSFSFNICSAGVFPPSGVPCTITWYSNPFNSTTISGATTVITSSGFLCPTTTVGTQTILPSTSTAGDFYYFCVITWTGGTASCPGGVSGSITSSSTQLIHITAPLGPITPGTALVADSVCLGSTLALSNAASGGSWTSSNGSVASVGASSGVVTGMSAGLANITYSLGGCFTTRYVSVRDTPNVILPSPAPAICVGNTLSLSSSTTGGTWLTSGSGIAMVSATGDSTADVTGMIAGTDIITYRMPVTQCYTRRVVTINPNPSTITGTAGVCVSSTTTLSNASTPGTWSSTASGIASVGSSTGIVSGHVAGTATIRYTYTTTGCYASRVVTVSTPPLPISSPASSVCAGSTITMTDASPGGTWSSVATTIASVNATGAVTGVSPGSTTIRYTITGCAPATRTINVSALPSPITGVFSACNGTTTSLADLVTGGRWYSGDTSIAVVDTLSGIVTGVSMGTVAITYRAASGCAVYATVTINPLAPILGTDTVCVGSNGSLTNIVGGGTWASSNPATASIDTFTGIVTGLVDGITFIVYRLPTACSTSFFLRVLPPLPSISGALSLCTGTSTTLSNLATGGTWATSNAFVADVNTTTGRLDAHFTDTASVFYTVYGCTTHSVVTVNPLPDPIVSFNSSTHALSTYNYYTSYQWFDSSAGSASFQAIPGATNSIYIVPDGSVYYYVAVTDTNGCIGTSSLRNPLDVSMVSASEVSIFPNPANDVVYINAPKILNVRISGIDGRVLIDKAPTGKVDISTLAKGIYIMAVTDEEGQLVTTRKLLKE